MGKNHLTNKERSFVARKKHQRWVYGKAMAKKRRHKFYMFWWNF